MCNKKWSEWKKDIIREAKSAGNLNDTLRLLAVAISSYYPEIKVWFTEKLGKRESFITGAGTEQYVAPQRMNIDNNITLFIQNADKINDSKKDDFVKICRILSSNY